VPKKKEFKMRLNKILFTLGVVFLSLIFSTVNQTFAEVELIEIVNLTNTPPRIQETSPGWSPDGSQIVFSRGCDYTAGGGGTSIWVMDADGSNQVQLTVKESSL
jgi:Tol biopolymer transport system component